MSAPTLNSIEGNNTVAPILSPVRKWGMLVVLSLALAIIILDTTILNVALSSIIQDLKTNIQNIQWVITGYSLTLAALTITGGRMGDIFGRKKMFLLGAILFAIGSFLASISTNVATLIVGESIIEGIGAALMMPATASLLVANFAGRERAIAFGIWGGIAGAAAALGPILGGYLATSYDWRWGFRINLFVVAALLISSFLIPESRDRKEKAEIDWLGVVLSATGMLSFAYGVIESTRYGWWTAKETFVAFGQRITLPWDLSVVPFFIIIGVAILTAFLLWESAHERRGHTPLVSPSIFKNRTFSSGVATTAIMALGQTGLIFALPIFLQSVRGLDAYHTGLALLPMSLALLIVAPLSAALSKKISAKFLIVLGLLVNVIAYVVLYGAMSVETTITDLIPGLTIFGIGMGLVMSQINNFTLSAVEVHQAGEASGINNTLRQIGSTLGSTIIGTILVGSLGANLLTGLTDSTNIPDPLKPQIAEALATQSSAIEFGGGAQLNGDLPNEVVTEIVAIGHQATTDSVKETLLYGGAFALAGFLVGLFFLPNKKKESRQPEPVAAPAALTPPPSPLPTYQLDTTMIADLITTDSALQAAGKPGLGTSVRALLDSATLGTLLVDHRLTWARRLWDNGLAAAAGFTDFVSYAKSVPAVPSHLLADDAEFPYLVFVERRLSVEKTCQVLGITIKNNPGVPGPVSLQQGGESYWTRLNHGQRYLGQPVNEVLKNAGVTGANISEGLALFMLSPKIVREQYLDLPASTYDGVENNTACLGTWHQTTQIRWRWADHADPRCGTVSKKV